MKQLLLLPATLLLLACRHLTLAQVTDTNIQFDPYNPNANPVPGPVPDPNNPIPPNFDPNQYDNGFNNNQNPVQFPPSQNEPYGGGGGQYDQFGKNDQFGRPDYPGGNPNGPWNNPNGYNFDRDTATEIQEA